MRRELREEAGVEIEVGRLVTTVPDFYGDTGEATVNAFYECRLRLGRSAARTTTSPSCAGSSADALPPPEELAFDGVRSALAAWLSAGGYYPAESGETSTSRRSVSAGQRLRRLGRPSGAA